MGFSLHPDLSFACEFEMICDRRTITFYRTCYTTGHLLYHRTGTMEVHGVVCGKRLAFMPAQCRSRPLHFLEPSETGKKPEKRCGFGVPQTAHFSHSVSLNVSFCEALTLTLLRLTCPNLHGLQEA